jgi:hypothetical protein
MFGNFKVSVFRVFEALQIVNTPLTPLKRGIKKSPLGRG